MRTVKASIQTELPLKELWQLVTDIKVYPHYVKFLKEVEIEEEVGLGAVWYDWTTILFVPMKIRHKIGKFIPEKEMGLVAELPFGGKMSQTVLVSGDQKISRLVGEINFDLGNRLLNFTLGAFLQSRLNTMMKATLANIQKESTGGEQ